MIILADGWSELVMNGGAILLFFLASSGIGLWLSRCFPGDWKQQGWLLIPFSMVAGLIPLSLLSLSFSMFERNISGIVRSGNVILLVAGLSGLALWMIKYGKQIRMGIPRLAGAAGILGFLVYLTARLSFMSDLLLPPYSDGVEHYLIVQDLLAPAASAQGAHHLGEILQKYYHFGFHGLVVWLVSTTGLLPEKAMLLTGQLIQVCMDLSVFFFLGITTRQPTAAFCGAGLAAVGWMMPGYASNWSKYPTMAGLAILPITAGILHTAWKEKNRSLLCWSGCFLLVIGMGVFHARTLVCLVILVLSYFLVLLLKRVIPQKAIPWAVLLVGVLTGSAFMSTHFLMSFYCARSCVVLAGVALLVPLAALSLPGLTLGVLLVVLGFLAANVLHLPDGLHYYSYVWLDGPFLEIAAYIPLSILGGVGVGGLMARITRSWMKFVLGCILLGLAVWSGMESSTFRPDPTCNFVQAIDLDAIHWIGENVPEDAVVITPGYEMGASAVGMDAGIWVEPLTGTSTVVMPFGTNWDAVAVVKKVCEYGDVYLYNNGGSTGFEKVRLTREDWYQTNYTNGKIDIIHVIACIGER